jgi:hypothetical protein
MLRNPACRRIGRDQYDPVTSHRRTHVFTLADDMPEHHKGQATGRVRRTV